MEAPEVGTSADMRDPPPISDMDSLFKNVNWACQGNPFFGKTNSRGLNVNIASIKECSRCPNLRNKFLPLWPVFLINFLHNLEKSAAVKCAMVAVQRTRLACIPIMCHVLEIYICATCQSDRVRVPVLVMMRSDVNSQGIPERVSPIVKLSKVAKQHDISSQTSIWK